MTQHSRTLLNMLLNVHPRLVPTALEPSFARVNSKTGIDPIVPFPLPIEVSAVSTSCLLGPTRRPANEFWSPFIMDQEKRRDSREDSQRLSGFKLAWSTQQRSSTGSSKFLPLVWRWSSSRHPSSQPTTHWQRLDVPLSSFLP